MTPVQPAVELKSTMGMSMVGHGVSPLLAGQRVATIVNVARSRSGELQSPRSSPSVVILAEAV